MDLNKVMLIGRLTQDPEVRTIPSGQSVAQFTVATNRVWRNENGEQKEQVEYNNVVAWRKLAEIVGQYLTKGRQVYIEGRLQTRSWEDQNGIKKYRTEIIAENMIMLGGKRKETTTDVPPPPPPPFSEEETSQTPSSNLPKEENKEGGSEEIKIEDIPF